MVFVCQNNRFAEHSRYEVGTSVDRIAKRAAGYAMPGHTVDGNDPHAMYAAAHEAIARARHGEGPTLLEALTFRFHGHVFGDTDAYMNAEEKAAALKRDPLPRFRTELIANGIATETALVDMETKLSAEIEDAIEFALGSEDPSLDELTTDVYSSAGAMA